VVESSGYEISDSDEEDSDKVEEENIVNPIFNSESKTDEISYV
jgi:hypothetical protein